MPQWPCTKVQRNEDHSTSTGEPSLFLRSSIHVVRRRKPCLNKDRRFGRPHALLRLGQRKRTWSCKKRPIRPRTRGLTYENNSQFRHQDRSHRGTFRRRGSFHFGPSRQNSVECGYCEKSVTTKKTIVRRSVSRLALADNSPITPPTPTMTIVAEYS